MRVTSSLVCFVFSCAVGCYEWVGFAVSHVRLLFIFKVGLPFVRIDREREKQEETGRLNWQLTRLAVGSTRHDTFNLKNSNPAHCTSGMDVL